MPYLAKSLGKLVIDSDNPELQSHACQVMSCELDSLQQEIELRLQASISCLFEPHQVALLKLHHVLPSHCHMLLPVITQCMRKLKLDRGLTDMCNNHLP